MTFSERMKLEDDYYLWLYDKQKELQVTLDDGPATFLAFLETQGYEVKKGAKHNDEQREV